MSQTWDPAEEHNVVGHELLTVTATTDPGTGATVVTVVGEVDMLTAPVLRQRLEEHFAAGQTPIIVDLSQVEFFGSTALAVLVDTHQRAAAEGRIFVLIAKTRIVRRPLKVTELDKVLSVYDDLDDALEAVHAGSVRPTTTP